MGQDEFVVMDGATMTAIRIRGAATSGKTTSTGNCQTASDYTAAETSRSATPVIA